MEHLDFTDKQRPWEALLLEVEKAAEAQKTTTIAVPAGTPPAIKNAVAALDSLDVGAHVAGVQSLADTDHAAARDALAKALQHPLKSVRMAAAIAFPDRKDPRIIPGLLDLHQNDDFMRQWYQGIEHLRMDSAKVRAASALALGQIGDATALTQLIQAFQDKKEQIYVRKAVAQALGLLGDPGAADVLHTYLTDRQNQEGWKDIRFSNSIRILSHYFSIS